MLQENYSDIGSAPDQRYFSLAWSSYLSRNYIISEEGTFGILDHATQITYDFPHVIDELCGIYMYVLSSWCFDAMLLLRTTYVSSENVDSCTTLKFSHTMFPHRNYYIIDLCLNNIE